MHVKKVAEKEEIGTEKEEIGNKIEAENANQFVFLVRIEKYYN